MVEHLLGRQKVRSSNLLGSTWVVSFDVREGHLGRGGHCRDPEVWHLGLWRSW